MTGGKHFITQIHPHQVTPDLRALFNPADPAALRCFAVLDGASLGEIYTDQPRHPHWGVVQEPAEGSLYLGGQIPDHFFRRLLGRLRIHRDVLVGLWPDDARWQLMPLSPDYEGFTLDFQTRQPGVISQDISTIPPGCELKRMDLELFERSAGKDYYLSLYGSAQNALEKGFGLCLTNQHELLCEAFAGPVALGYIEMGTATHSDHRRKGYATLTCSRLITEMEQRGYRTYWNCAKDNLASTALAHKLGYRGEREYRLMAWFKKAN